MKRLLALGLFLTAAGSAAAQKEVIVVGPGGQVSGAPGGLKIMVPGKDGIAMPPISPEQMLPMMANMPGPGEMALRYLEMPETQKELKLTGEEKSSIPLLRDEVKDGDKKMMESLKGASDISEFPKKMDARKKEIEKQIAEVLGAKYARYQQVCRQLDGLSRCIRSDAAVKEAIKLSDDQETKLREGMMANMKFEFKGGIPDPEEMAKQVEEMQKKQNDLVVSLLTETQKAKWKELTGEPISFKAPAPKVPKFDVKMTLPPGPPPAALPTPPKNP